jgi:hypothetical protein
MKIHNSMGLTQYWLALMSFPSFFLNHHLHISFLGHFKLHLAHVHCDTGLPIIFEL